MTKSVWTALIGVCVVCIACSRAAASCPEPTPAVVAVVDQPEPAPEPASPEPESPESIVPHACPTPVTGAVVERDGGRWLEPSGDDPIPVLLPPAPSDARVLAHVCLPARGRETPEEPWAEPGPGVVILNRLCPDLYAERLCLELIVLGDAFEVAFVADGASEPEFLVGLPPDSISVIPTSVGEAAAWHVWIDAPLRWRPNPACWMGTLQVRVDAPVYDDDRRAVAEVYGEFGKCE